MNFRVNVEFSTEDSLRQVEKQIDTLVDFSLDKGQRK